MKTATSLALILLPLFSAAETIQVPGPDSRLVLTVDAGSGSMTPRYSISYDGKPMLAPSPLGFLADTGNYSDSLSLKGHEVTDVHVGYSLPNIKKSTVEKNYKRLSTRWVNNRGLPFEIEFMVGDNDVAFRYVVPRQNERGSIRVMNEKTGFRLPENSTAFLTPQSEAMIGWKRTKPSYEERYVADVPMTEKSDFGHGYTFPALFHTPDGGWVLISETGVDSRYCASHLSDYTDGVYEIAFPMPEENNGNGTVEPAFSLPGTTPWRTVTVGATPQPIVETTVAFDVTEPRYISDKKYKYGRGTWSWILWQDESINFEDQKKYIDLASAMGYEYTLVDNWWDTNIGREGIEKLAEYARSKGVGLFIWYSSSGYWNDIVQGPTNKMDNSISRKHEMKWLRDIGAKGIKVDFFGGDKQETMRLYEQILSDADDYGLMAIFHGCTLPRGWERMYPNYVGSEAVLASENMIFGQNFCDDEAFNATLHPFIRNAVGCMEFGGVFMNKRMNRGNDGGNVRRTSDVFQLATGILFQNPIQNFALAPNNLTDAPQICMDFMRGIPTTWDDIRFIDGYPGRYVVLARRHADRWYVAAINATDTTVKLKLNLDFLAGASGECYSDGKNGPEKKAITIPGDGKVNLDLRPKQGAVYVVTAPV